MNPHGCTTLLLRCMDYPLEPSIHEFLQEEKLAGDCDIVSLPGAAKTLNGNAEDMLIIIGLAKDLHGIKRVILLNHTDCGAYRGNAFESLRDEENFHTRELQAARDRVKTQFRDLEVLIYLARVSDTEVRIDKLQ